MAATLARICHLLLLSSSVFGLVASQLREADVAEVLTKCLGRETLVRWQKQLVAASRFCGGENLLVEDDLVQVNGSPLPSDASADTSPAPANTSALVDNPAPTSTPASVDNPAAVNTSTFVDTPVEPADSATGEAPHPQAQEQQPEKGMFTPLTIVPSTQPFIPSLTYPFYLQKISYPQFVSVPYLHKKYYFISAPKSPAISSPQPTFPSPSSQNTSPNHGLPFVQNVPGFSKPIVQYYPVRKPGDHQYFYQPMEPQASEQSAPAVARPLTDTTQRVVTHDQTYTDPGLKLEQTEQYQRAQQILASEQQDSVRREEARQSADQPLRGGIGRPRNSKKKRDAAALSVFRPLSSSTFREWPTSPAAEQFSHERHLRLVVASAAERLGNMTCVMKAMKALTDDLEPNYDFIANSLLELPVSHQVYEELKSGQEYCQKFSQCLPERKKISGIEMSPNLSKAFEFFRCFAREKVRVCLQSDPLTQADLLNRLSVPRNTVFHPRHSKLGQTLGEVDQLLNGAGSQFLDLVLL